MLEWHIRQLRDGDAGQKRSISIQQHTLGGYKIMLKTDTNAEILAGLENGDLLRVLRWARETDWDNLIDDQDTKLLH